MLAPKVTATTAAFGLLCLEVARPEHREGHKLYVVCDVFSAGGRRLFLDHRIELQRS
jgi:hypothetical protein